MGWLPTSWDQGAWGLALSVVGVALAVWALVKARSAKAAVANAVRLSIAQTVIAHVADLRTIEEQLVSAAEQNNAPAARAALTHWLRVSAETLGLLADLPGDSDEEFHADLVLSGERARASLARLARSGTVGAAVTRTQESMTKVVFTGGVLATRARSAISKDAGT